jgi:hypothetical protein
VLVYLLTRPTNNPRCEESKNEGKI